MYFKIATNTKEETQEQLGGMERETPGELSKAAKDSETGCELKLH